jgi:hypothetical protein
VTQETDGPREYTGGPSALELGDFVDASSGWFVALGSVLSILGGIASNWLGDRATTKRDQLAKEHERKAKLSEFQAQTLVELQDAMNELLNAAEDQRTSSGYRGVLEVEKAASRTTRARLAVYKLRARVQDDEVRHLVLEFMASTAFLVHPEKFARLDDEGEEIIRPTTADTYEPAIERIGEVLRGLYEVI